MVKPSKVRTTASSRVLPGATVDRADDRSDKHRSENGASLERYLLMDEKEKDLEIQKAVARLQKRIQEILYLLDTDRSRAAGRGVDKKK